MIIWMCYVGFRQSSRGSGLDPVWGLNPFEWCVCVYMCASLCQVYWTQAFLFFSPSPFPKYRGHKCLDSVSVTKLNQAQTGLASLFFSQLIFSLDRI